MCIVGTVSGPGGGSLKTRPKRVVCSNVSAIAVLDSRCSLDPHGRAQGRPGSTDMKGTPVRAGATVEVSASDTPDKIVSAVVNAAVQRPARSSGGEWGFKLMVREREPPYLTSPHLQMCSSRALPAFRTIVFCVFLLYGGPSAAVDRVSLLIVSLLLLLTPPRKPPLLPVRPHICLRRRHLLPRGSVHVYARCVQAAAPGALLGLAGLQELRVSARARSLPLACLRERLLTLHYPACPVTCLLIYTQPTNVCVAHLRSPQVSYPDEHREPADPPVAG